MVTEFAHNAQKHSSLCEWVNANQPLLPINAMRDAVNQSGDFSYKRAVYPTNDEQLSKYFDLRIQLQKRSGDYRVGSQDENDANEYDDPMAFLRLALWGLLEYEGYEFLPKVTPRKEFRMKNSLVVDRYFKRLKYLGKNMRPVKAMPSLMYSFFILGEVSLPENVPEARLQIEDLILEVYSMDNALFNPVLLIALGNSILEVTHQFKNFRNPASVFTPFSPIRRYLAKNQRMYKTSQKHMVRMMHHLQKKYKECNAVAAGKPCVKALSHLAFLVYTEYRTITTMAYSAYMYANIRMKTQDFVRLATYAKFDMHFSTFMKTMAYYGRTFVRLGTKMIRDYKNGHRRIRKQQLDLNDVDKLFKIDKKDWSWWELGSLKKLTKGSWLPQWLAQPSDKKETFSYSKKYSPNEMPGVFWSENVAIEEFLEESK